MCGVVLVYLLYLYIVGFVNKTSRDKGGACSNEKRKRCNWIPSVNTLGRNDPTAGYKLFLKQTVS